MSIERFQDHTPRIHAQAFVHASAVVIGQVRIGAQSSVWPNVTLRGDDGPIVVGARTSIQDGTVVHMTEGRSVTTVGNQVTVGHKVILHGCTIEDDCIVGMGSIILDDAVVERGSIVGAGAVVPPGKRVLAGSVVVGNPFRVLRACTEQDLEFIAYSWREYVERTRQYLEAASTP
ncbi:gamma carbonic anhydrase family protein [Paraliomyxa miuraensis]|uniref:gamma carbonic anhydrase family protein n=1 Tax=Paraliomyxa miuraensis TaxID=376150 RepID=UPI002255CED4|nr:gamma carbonic anhydrase family protein [Paraliomyxa miuraensis]MCX4243460.1 gamma carbonic anhydrase family protein [Paraliomyxa miuraensis]